MLLDHGPALLARNVVEPIRAANTVLPADVLETHPALAGVAGLFRRAIGDPAGAVGMAAQASEVAATYPVSSVGQALDRDAVYADAMMLALWKTLFGWQDVSTTVAEARQALGCTLAPVHVHRPTLVLSPDRHAWLMLELASAEIWAGELNEASVHVDEGLVGAGVADNPGLIALALSQRAIIELLNSNARLAADSAREALVHGRRLPVTGGAHADRSHLVLAWVAYIRLDFKEAADWLSRIRDTSNIHPAGTVVQIMRLVLQSALLAESGDVDQAQRTLIDPVGTSATLPRFLVRTLGLFRWNAATAAGDLETASHQVDELRQAGFSAEADFLDSARLASDGDLEQALELAERSLRSPGDVDSATRACAAVIKTALLLLLGDRDTARLSLLDALSRTAQQEARLCRDGRTGCGRVVPRGPV